MNGRLGVGSAVLLTGLVACGSQAGGSVPRREGAATTSVSTTGVSTTSMTTTSITSTSMTTTSLDAGRTTDTHAVVRGNGGLIEVRGDGKGALEIVRLEPADGWTPTVERPGPGELVVRFEHGPSAEQFGFQLTATGIHTSMSSNGSSSG